MARLCLMIRINTLFPTSCPILLDSCVPEVPALPSLPSLNSIQLVTAPTTFSTDISCMMSLNCLMVLSLVSRSLLNILISSRSLVVSVCEFFLLIFSSPTIVYYFFLLQDISHITQFRNVQPLQIISKLCCVNQFYRFFF